MSRRNNCNLSIEATHWIDGEMLGDGHIHKVSSRSAIFVYCSKYLEYIEYVRDTLKSFGIEQAGKINKQYYEKYNCCTYHYASRAYPELLSIQKRWYPEGKKIVPKGIVLTPLVCRQWYIGDGSLAYKEKNYSLLLCTCAFPEPDVMWLIKQLREIGFWAIWRKRNMISIVNKSNKKFNNFLEYIGKCPVECYKYKWLLNSQYY